jgi:hypothetical protein
VLQFEGNEGVSGLYRYDIELTSVMADIPMDGDSASRNVGQYPSR